MPRKYFAPNGDFMEGHSLAKVGCEIFVVSSSPIEMCVKLVAGRDTGDTLCLGDTALG